MKRILFLSDFNKNWKVSVNSDKKSLISVFTQIRLVGGQNVPCGQTDGMTKLVVVFRNCFP
jgi:hypothetical protein